LDLHWGNLDMYSNFIKSPSRVSPKAHNLSNAATKMCSCSRLAVRTIGFVVSLERDGSDEIGANPVNWTSYTLNLLKVLIRMVEFYLHMGQRA
jgi:hypothetical protein